MLAAAQCIVIGPVCLWVGVFVCVGGWVCYHDNSKLCASILTKLGLYVKVVTIFSWLSFGPPAPQGRGSAVGRKFLAPPYYSQCAVFASPLSTFSFFCVTGPFFQRGILSALLSNINLSAWCCGDYGKSFLGLLNTCIPRNDLIITAPGTEINVWEQSKANWHSTSQLKYWVEKLCVNLLSPTFVIICYWPVSGDDLPCWEGLRFMPGNESVAVYGLLAWMH